MKADFNQASIGQVKRALRDALGPLPEINWPLDKSWAVIRARVVNPENEDISLPSTFGAPPPIETSQGRANLVNFPVFYGTFDARNAMQELDVDVGTECYVSIWGFEKETPIATTFLSGAAEKNDLARLQGKLPEMPLEQLKGGYTKSSLAKGMELRASAFTQGNYELTSKIAHDIIYNRSALSDALIYPGVKDPYRCNIALNPDFVNANMHCVRVYKMVWSGAFIFRMLARATNDNGKLDWQPTGSFELDEVDRKYSGSNGPSDIHPSALEVLKDSSS
ncbi:MAG: RES domain-containing protein [Pseudomonadota bacterium]